MQNLKKILKNKKGFTLVELMVVVAILGILVAVAVPVYNNVTDSAKQNTCDSNIQTIKSAVTIALADGKTPTELGGAVKDNTVLKEYLDSSDMECPVKPAATYSVSFTTGTNQFTVTHDHTGN